MWATSRVLAGLLLSLLMTPLMASVSSGGALNGVRVNGPVPSGGGGAIPGVEDACAESGLYGSGGNCVCSEPLNAALSFLDDTANNDPSDSPNTHECWGRLAPAWLSTDAPISTVSVSGASGWGTTSYALRQTGAAVWAMLPLNAITSSTRTLCMRYFRQYEGAMSSDGSCRLKVAQLNWGSTSNPKLQAQVKADGPTGLPCTTTPKYHQLTGGGPIDGNYNTTVYTDECDGKPCKFELCVDGNVLAGTNLQGRFRVTSYEGAGEISTATTPVFNGGGAPSVQDLSGGDWWHSNGGSETMLNGQFSVWAWDTDTDQWPPTHCEIEGGC